MSLFTQYLQAAGTQPLISHLSSVDPPFFLLRKHFSSKLHGLGAAILSTPCLPEESEIQISPGAMCQIPVLFP